MGEIKDIIDTIQEFTHNVGQFRKDAGVFSVKRSISAKAMDGTCVFPALADTSTPMEDLLTITRALERKYASFILTTLTMDPYLSTDNGNFNAAEYVQRFHQNMMQGIRPVGANLQNAINMLETVENKYNFDYTYMAQEASVTAAHVYSCIESKLANRQIEKWNYVIEDVTTPRSLNDLSCPRRSVMEASTTKPNPNVGKTKFARDFHMHKGSYLMKADIRPTINIDPKNINTNISSSSSANNTVATGDGQRTKTASQSAMNHSVDMEMKKANDLVPTMLHLRVYPKSDQEGVELPEPIDFVLGIKVNLIPIDPVIMAEQLAKGVNADNAFFNFIKFTTGETKFFKDFVFAVERQKSMAVDSESPLKGWFTASRRRGNAARILNKMMTDKNLSAIMTIIISTETIEQLRDIYGYDFNRVPALINQIMNTYWLLGFVTVDASLERVTFRFDGQAPETMTMNTLMREESKDDRKFKEMMKMIGRSM